MRSCKKYFVTLYFKEFYDIKNIKVLKMFFIRLDIKKLF